MKPTTKLRAGSASELTRLKELWRRMGDDARAGWLQRFVSSAASQAELRRELSSSLKIHLRHDSQLTKFRDWAAQQEALDAEAEAMEEDEARLLAEHPEWTKEQVREDVLRKAYLRARSHGDFKLGLKTVAADAKLTSLKLEREKFEFDAAKACLAKLPELKVVSETRKLSDAEKTAAIQRILFGK